MTSVRLSHDQNRGAHPQQFHGVVTEAGKMAQTVTVTVSRHVWLKKIHKQMKRSKTFLVHDEQSEARVGDRVTIEKCRPMSRRKHFRIIARVPGRGNAKGVEV